jgi:hypothetical protein
MEEFGFSVYFLDGAKALSRYHVAYSPGSYIGCRPGIFMYSYYFYEERYDRSKSSQETIGKCSNIDFTAFN